MARPWKDTFGEDWEVDLLQDGEEHPDTGEPLPFALLRFETGDRSAEVFVRGTVADSVDELDEHGLELAMEAARDGRGFVFADSDGHLWWVKGAGEDDVDEGMHPVTFDDGIDELRHPGPLSAPPDELSDDELEELLDQARGVAA